MELKGILIGSEDAEALANYYTKLFGEPGWSEEGYFGWMFGSGNIMIGPHDQVHGKNPEPGRVIWNLETEDVKGEFERLRGMGAIVVREPYDPSGESSEQEMLIATLADPDGNYFQLASPWEEQK